MRILDDALPRDDYLALQAALLDPAFPWQPSPILSNAPGLDPQHNRQLVHGFFLDKPGFRHASPRLPLLQPLLELLRPRALIKVKLNLTPRQERHVEYGLHVDTRRPGATTAIYYLNDNDGYTVFEDGEKVASAANRLVVFDASRRHTGASCTDADYRLVLNLNFMA